MFIDFAKLANFIYYDSIQWIKFGINIPGCNTVAVCSNPDAGSFALTTVSSVFFFKPSRAHVTNFSFIYGSEIICSNHFAPVVEKIRDKDVHPDKNISLTRKKCDDKN